MRLIVGLGNPGEKYERTRHNAGFMAVQTFHRRHNNQFDDWKEKFQALISEGRIGKEKVVLVLPQTFMNESGRAVQEMANFWKIEPTNIVVVLDDFSLPFSALRLRREGSAGGHNGLKSIIEAMSTEEVPRLRLGIGNIQMYKIPAEKFVLEKFNAIEESDLNDVLERTTDVIEVILADGLDTAMNEFN
ncbi:aminoacyl-tRNA hydrolase [Candidatus Uhrbacteria bacterium RIFOXYC2_FULL_47_19]|uniref:Peptidyl-tRNA hydrolase n=1 Tax=Candidatus Uhrbacteria bacterium RIFOXYC2_FULL_47_19 TaxID=1802424 RepID=A0A1F7WGR6_9BACT|nr:MAG: aminoacyl-tRNA hydrolase [Candidatus Uhrbacteria bacterium RIFOXYC2_FULL_47_19]